MKNAVKIVVLGFLLAGCAGGLVCRHTVMSDAAWATEEGLQYEIVVYMVSPAWSLGIFNAHVQVRTERGWVSTMFGYPVIAPDPQYPMAGWSQGYDLSQYVTLMRRNCFNGADCREEGIP